ncbi:MAG: hypothetical protein KDA45_03700 [Planctomycetales bacterium]|nr:hypothetical protein [Planctomycetales bacterium]
MIFDKRPMAWIVVASLLASQGGCVTMSALMGQKRTATLDTHLLEAQGYSIPPGGMPSPVAPDPSGKPRVVLEVRVGERHLESIPLPLDRGMFIEELVQQAQLHDRFGNLNISIMRPNGAGKPPVRLEAAIDDKGKAKSVGQNYALQPGDHIIVVNDNRSSLERFIDKTFDR